MVLSQLSRSLLLIGWLFRPLRNDWLISILISNLFHVQRSFRYIAPHSEFGLKRSDKGRDSWTSLTRIYVYMGKFKENNWYSHITVAHCVTCWLRYEMIYQLLMSLSMRFSALARFTTAFSSILRYFIISGIIWFWNIICIY